MGRKATVFFSLCFFVYASASVLGQTLIIEARPQFSDKGFVENNGYQYLLSDIQDIRVDGSEFERVPWNQAQNQQFYFIHPEGYVECKVNIPVSGEYHIYTRLCQHGDVGPQANVYVDGQLQEEISGQRKWHKITVELEAGVRVIRYEESGTGSKDWPYRLVGFDAVAITNDPDWTPPNTLSTHPYTGNQYWWSRPSEQIEEIKVAIDEKTAVFSGKWNYTDILLIDSSGNSQGTAVDFSVSGDSLSGEDLSRAAVTKNTSQRVHPDAMLMDRSLSRMKPNFDMIEDEVKLNIPDDQSGYVTIKRYNGTDLHQMPEGIFTWDGRLGNDIYSDFAQKMGYLLEFTPSTADAVPMLACVYSNPETPGRVRPRVLEISPNGDDVYDIAEIHLNDEIGFQFVSVDEVVVRNSSGDIVKKLPQSDPIVWDGTDESGKVCPPGTYSIEILDRFGRLRAGSKINSLDLPATSDEPFDQGDFYILGMWLGFESSITPEELDKIVDMNCNTIRIHGPGSRVSGSSRVADRWWKYTEERDLKVMVNLAEIIHPILDLPMAPSEPQLKEMLAPYVDAIKDKSGLIVYELVDEPSYTPERGYRLRAIQQVLHRLDPDRPSVPVLIGYDERISGYVADMKPQQLLLDIYPCRQETQPGDFRNIWGYEELDTMEYVDWAMELVEPRGVPTWIIHQAHRFFDGLREPEPEEIALQVWLGLSRGITGSFFFIYETQQDWIGIQDNPQISQAIADIYGRLKEPAVYKVLPHLQKADFEITVTGGGLEGIYETAEARPLAAGEEKFIIAVNRARDFADITINSSDFAEAELMDLETGQKYQMGQEIRFLPFDGRIFKLLI